MLIGVALVAAACTSDPVETTTTSSSSTSTTVAPTSTTLATTTTPGLMYPVGGEAVIAYDEEPPTLNSFLPGGDRLVVGLISQTYAAGIQDVDGYTLELVPELLTELPTVENGGVVINPESTMTVKYEIRDDAQWSDGTPISGNDFQFTFDTIMNPDLPITKLYYESIIETVAGPKTFEYTMAAPTVQHELMFSEIIPKHDVEESDFLHDWNTERWVSAGPFVFDSWVEGESIKVSRNDSYWKVDVETGQSLPFLDEVVFRFIPDDEEIIRAFTARDVDVITPDATTDVIEALRALEGEGAAVEVLSGPVWEHLNFQFGPGRLERNASSCAEYPEMRLAVAHAIDRAKLTEEIFAGEVSPLDSYVAAFAPQLSNDNWAAISHDPTKANEYYLAAVEAADLACTVVFTATSNNDARVQMAELFIPMFEAAGIPFENELDDAATFFGETLEAGLWDLSEWAWVGSPGFTGLVVLHDVFDPEGKPPAGSNYYRWGTDDSSVIDESTQRFAAIRDRLNATVDARELEDLITEAEQILFDSLVIIPLFSRPVTAAVWADEITRFKHNPTTAGHTWNIEEWYRADLDS